MGEPKPLASLSSGLLARKGAARPAMRRQPLGSGIPGDGASQDDLGWNDMGYDVDPAQGGEAPRMVDLTPMLTNSLPHAVPPPVQVAPPPVQATPPVWYNAGQDEEDDEDGDFGASFGDEDFDPSRSPLSIKPHVLQQQEALAERVAPPPVAEAPAPAPVAAQPEPVFAPEPAPAADIVREPETAYAPAAVPVAATVASIVPQAPIRRAPRRASEPKAREKAAFTLRLDAERHLRLRLASAVNHRSAQLIMIDLLDDYLASLPEIDAMASRLPAAKANRL